MVVQALEILVHASPLAPAGGQHPVRNQEPAEYDLLLPVNLDAIVELG
jgi:hypothetical protein